MQGVRAKRSNNLADSHNCFTIHPRYWSDFKRQLTENEGFSQLYGKIVQLKLASSDGKKYDTDTANTETIFRIIQSIPSPKAEPFKRWLAKVGYERVQEIEDPELATQRTRAIYKAKGYSDEWIEKRMRGIAIREELTDEWDKRGVKMQREYAILTAEISKATFGMTPSEYKKHKSLQQENLRDHMTDLELIFSMLGEAATKEIAFSFLNTNPGQSHQFLLFLAINLKVCSISNRSFPASLDILLISDMSFILI
jgi:DNA-damage-inducible protein D